MPDARPRSPLDLPPRQVNRPRRSVWPEAPGRESTRVTAMPVSFGVVALGLGLVALGVLGVCGGAFAHLQNTWGAKLRASEQRHGTQLRQLHRDMDATTARLLHAEALLAEQARNIELLRAELEDLRRQDRDPTRHSRTHRLSAR